MQILPACHEPVQLALLPVGMQSWQHHDHKTSQGAGPIMRDVS